MGNYLIIQLIFLIIAIGIGIYNTYLGMTRAGMWTFPRKRHFTLGAIFFLSILIFFLFTLFLLPSFRRERIRIPGYSGLSWFIFLLSLSGAVLGIIRSQKRSILSRYKRIDTSAGILHPWPLILAIGFSFALIFTIFARFFLLSH